MGLTDRQLIERARGGDREAFGDLVDRYRDMVYGLGYHLTRDFEAAQDLAQEAFVLAYLKLGQLRDPDKFSGWLRQIATNLHHNAHRRRQVATVALEEAAELADTRHPSEIEAVVREMLGKLRAPDRLAVTLHYINGYSHGEIGEFLGVRPETVKTRLARARQHLRKEMLQMVEDIFDQNALPKEFREDVIKAVDNLVENLRGAISGDLLKAANRLKRETNRKWRNIIERMPPEILPRPLGEMTLTHRPPRIAIADIPSDLRGEVWDAMCTMWFWIMIQTLADFRSWDGNLEGASISFYTLEDGRLYVGGLSNLGGAAIGLGISPEAVEEEQASVGNDDDFAAAAGFPLPEELREAFFRVRRAIPGSPGSLYGALYAKMADLLRQAREMLPEEILKTMETKPVQVRELPGHVLPLLRDAFSLHWGSYVLKSIEHVPSWLRKFDEAKVELGVYGRLEGVPEPQSWIGCQYVEVQDVGDEHDGLQTSVGEQFDPPE